MSASRAPSQAPGEPATDALDPSSTSDDPSENSAPITPLTISLEEPAVCSAAESASTGATPFDGLDAATQAVVSHLRQYIAKETSELAGSKLQALIEELTASVEPFRVYPLLRLRAVRALGVFGADSRDTILAVCSVIENDFQRDYVEGLLYQWVLPRYAQHFGVDHPNTRALVLRAAVELSLLEDPREHAEFTRVVTELAEQLPGGLGWGDTVAAPVPDEDAYIRHAMMQTKSDDLINEGQYKLAHTMLQRCVAFYDGLGQKWLGRMRKCRARCDLHNCVKHLDGLQAAEAQMQSAKNTAERELGSNHPTTLAIAWDYGYVLRDLGQIAEGLEMGLSTMRVRKEVLGPRHIRFTDNQVTIADILRKVRSFTEAERMCKGAFEVALRVGGPEHPVTGHAYLTYTLLLSDQNRLREQRAFQARAKKLGVRMNLPY